MRRFFRQAADVIGADHPVSSGQRCDFRPAPNTKCLTTPFLLTVWMNGLPVIFAVVTLTFDPCVAEVELVV